MNGSIADRQAEQRVILRKALAALEAGGITPVLLKGLSLAHYYPKPEERPAGDIDIYVGKEHYHNGARILRETFPDAPHFDEEAEYFKHYNLNIGSTAIEMHRVSADFKHPRDARVYDELERDGLQRHFVRYEHGEDKWNAPEYNFNVLFVFVHSWHHFTTESALLRQFTDLAYLLLGGKPDVTYLEKNLKRLHLLHAWQLYAYILVNYLSLPQESCPLYTDKCARRAQLLFQSMLHPKRAFSEETKVPAPKNVILRKLFTLRVRLHEARAIARFEPHYARHLVLTAFAQSWDRFKKGESTRTWE